MKTIFLIIIILNLFQYHSFSQDQHLIDSLQTQLKNHNAKKLEFGKNAPAMFDTTAANILYEISQACWFNDLDKGIDYATLSLQIAEHIHSKKEVAKANYSLSVLQMNKGNSHVAYEYCNKTLSIAKQIDDKYIIADIYANLGFICNLLGKIQEAQKHCYAAIKLADEIGYKQCTVIAYTNLGSIYYSQNNLPDVTKCYSYALNLAEKIDFKLYMAANYHNIGIIHADSGKYDEAIKFVKVALDINHEINNGLWEAYNYNLIGCVLDLQNKNKEALQYFLNCAKLAESINEKAMLSTALTNTGSIYLKMKDYVKARKYLNEGLKLMQEYNFVTGLSDSYQNLTELDTATGNWKLAFADYTRYIYYRDSILNAGNTKKLVETSMQYDFDKKQIADSLKFAKEKEIGALLLQRQKTITYTGFAGVVITILFLFFVYRSYNKQRIANQKLKEAQEQLIKSEKMAAFGVMASRVSHEILNPLNFVNNFSELSQGLVEDIISTTDETDKKQNADLLIANLQKINEQGKKAADIVKQLQEHTNKGTAHDYFEAS